MADKEITAPLRTLRQLLDALRALDVGAPKETAKGEVMAKPYELSGDVLLAISINMNALDPLYRGYDQATRKMTLQRTKDNGTVAPSDILYVEEEAEKLLAAEHTVKLRTIARAHLGAENNKLRPAILAGLTPIIDE